jgi:tetratricopeptide (TPR) repeat protein
MHYSLVQWYTLVQCTLLAVHSTSTLITLVHYTHTPIHPYTHTPIHPYTHTPIHPYTHTSIHPYTHTPLAILYSLYTLNIHQRASRWEKAINDAKKVISISPAFTKGYLHLANSYSLQPQPQLAQAADAIKAGLRQPSLARSSELQQLGRKIHDLQQGSTSSTSSSSAPTAPRPPSGTGSAPSSSSSSSSSSEPSAGAKSSAEQLKGRAAGFYKAGQYAQALRRYSEAINCFKSPAGVSGASAALQVQAKSAQAQLYSNRAACWLMMQKWEHAADDCGSGLRLDPMNQRLCDR